MQCAEVVGIVKRGWHPVAATLQPDVVSPLWVLAVPVDTRLPKIRLQTQQEQQLKSKTIVVAFDAWDATSRYPTGHYVRTLGETGDKNVEAEALCIDHEVDTRAFSQKVINCLPPKTWVVSAPCTLIIKTPNRYRFRHLRRYLRVTTHLAVGARIFAG
jgi:exosome complex exonuclease DIS3/RRP44